MNPSVIFFLFCRFYFSVVENSRLRKLPTAKISQRNKSQCQPENYKCHTPAVSGLNCKCLVDHQKPVFIENQENEISFTSAFLVWFPLVLSFSSVSCDPSNSPSCFVQRSTKLFLLQSILIRVKDKNMKA